MVDVNEDAMIAELSEEIDNQLMKWIITYELPGLNLTAILLARLTMLSKQGNYVDDFLQLLESPKSVVREEQIKTQVH